MNKDQIFSLIRSQIYDYQVMLDASEASQQPILINDSKSKIVGAITLYSRFSSEYKLGSHLDRIIDLKSKLAGALNADCFAVRQTDILIKYLQAAYDANKIV